MRSATRTRASLKTTISWFPVLDLVCNLINLGAFGEVYQCKHRKTAAHRALKVIYKSSLDEEESDKLINEVKILKQLVTLRLRVGSSEYLATS